MNKLYKHWRKFSTEIEFATNDMPQWVFERDENNFRPARTDGSICGFNKQQCYNCGEGLYFCDCGDYEDQYDSDDYYNFVGEVASKPMTTLRELRDFHNEFAHVDFNKSCGQHVHVELSYKDYLNLVWHYDKFNKDFQKFHKYFGESRSLNESHQYFRRQYNNTFCNPKLTLDDVRHQLTNTSYHSSRYRNINFCYAKHHTLEFRHLPMFKDVHLRVDATIAILDFLDNWLHQHQMRFPKIEVEI